MTTTMTVGAIKPNAAVVANSPFSKVTFAAWIDYCDIKPCTQRTYNKSIENFAKYLANNSIEQPQRQDVINYRESLLNGGYAVSSVRLYLTVVKKFFKWLSSNLIYANVADNVKIPEMPTEHSRDAISIEEARQAISSFTGETEKQLRDKCILSLMIGAGLRSVEICRLDVGDLEKRKGIWFLNIHGKARSGKTDSVKVTSEMKKLLDAYLSVRPKGKKNSPLFISTANRCRGARLQTQTVSRLAKRTFKAVGIESSRICCHSCRHTFITELLNAGVAMRNVQLGARHRSATVTERYAHDKEKFNNPAFDIMSRLLFVA